MSWVFSEFFVGNNCMGRLICPTGGTLVGVCTNIGECCAANGDYYHYYKNLCFFFIIITIIIGSIIIIVCTNVVLSTMICIYY